MRTFTLNDKPATASAPSHRRDAMTADSEYLNGRLRSEAEARAELRARYVTDVVRLMRSGREPAEGAYNELADRALSIEGGDLQRATNLVALAFATAAVDKALSEDQPPAGGNGPRRPGRAR